MSEGFPFLDIIFFAMIAAFILLRLRSVLGRRTGHERRSPNPLVRRSAEEASDKVVPLPERESAKHAEVSDIGYSSVEGPLTQIKVADPSFDTDHFLAGASGAFKVVVEAFAAGDTARLRPLLSDGVYESFAKAIEERTAAGHTRETALVAIKEATILDAGLERRVAQITLKFVSEQMNVTRDADGDVIEGDPRAAATVTDIWTFERDTRSRDPNWTLVSTRNPH
ncbi:MAG: Tim44/TimA family putative adaptor protein [Alphaproteobacteria bacterium]